MTLFVQVLPLTFFSISMLATNLICAKEVIYFNTLSSNITLPIRSWKTLRDTDLVKQDFDYSCGAASIATILNTFYQQSVTEADILTVIDKQDLHASFEDMAYALSSFGFRAIGFSASFKQVRTLKIPVIVYLRYRNDDHFSVLRGINANTVWLADPSLGNRYYTHHQFLQMWETRNTTTLKGKFLAILPNRSDKTTTSSIFSTTFNTRTALAISLQKQRHFPY